MLPNYLTLARARELLAELPQLKRLNALSDTALVNATAIASLRVDASDKWDGVKLDAAQALAFPRKGCDWEQSEVPLNVELAVLHEAEWMQDPTRARAAAAVAAGIAAQSTGSLSVSYAQGSLRTLPICDAAGTFMSQFVLTLGETY